MAKKKMRSDGRYEVKITVNGKRYSVYGSTQAEAKENANEKKKQLMEGRYIKSDKLTFDQFYERLEDNTRGTKKPSTTRSNHYYFASVSKIVIDKAGTTFGSLKINEIEKQNVVDLQRGMQAAKKKDGTPKYNVTTINGCINLVKHVLKNAVDEDYIQKNPAKSVKPLKKVETKAISTIHRALTIEETTAFFKAAEDSYYYNLFRFLICSGCRIGEAGGLKNTDIDRKDNLIKIRRTITMNESGGYVVGDSTKTADGKRDIPLTEGIRAAILGQKQTMIDYGISLRMDNIVFCSPEGYLLNHYGVNREVTKICKRAGIERFTAHAFRDTFATRCIESGMNPKTLQAILGHSDINMTMNIYAHVMQDTKIKEMNNVSIAI